MAPFLHQQVLGTKNVTGIYTLIPTTHPQTTNGYPDMVALEMVEQFSLVNQITLPSAADGSAPLTGNSHPVNSSYAPGNLPSGVAAPIFPCPACQGLDFRDEGGVNETLINSIIKANVPGFYVFSAPWETTSALLTNINQLDGYNLTLPSAFKSSDLIYAITITPAGSASLVTYNSNVNPPSTYPSLPAPGVVNSACAATPFSITVTGGVGGAVIPAGINTNETIYMIRHAEAHPGSSWDDGNYVAAGQWRALGLPSAMNGKINPNQVWSIDPAQIMPGALITPGNSDWSYTRAALTVEPYAIANNLPYHLVTNFGLVAANAPQLTSTFFFNGGTFSNQKLLLAWEHLHIPMTVNALLATYYPNGGAPTAPEWMSPDYDSIWTATTDSAGNLTVDNAKCEGIDSAELPATAPNY
jgi:hypothetical protein